MFAQSKIISLLFFSQKCRNHNIKQGQKDNIVLSTKKNLSGNISWLWCDLSKTIQSVQKTRFF